MADFDYYMVLPGVVAALALGRLLRGAALSLERPEVTWHPLHLAWASILFVAQLISWHESSGCRGCVDVGKSLLHYLAFLGFPTTIYLASTVLIPDMQWKPEKSADKRSNKLDLGDHYYSHGVQFFSICTVALLVAIVANSVLPCDGDDDWFSTKNKYRFLGVVLTVVLAWISKCGRKHEVVHGILTGAAVLMVGMFAWKLW